MITGIMVQPNKAIVGANAFAHEAGIHQDGVLKNPMTYEIMRPETVGLSKNNMVLGKHSGRHALRSHLADMGYVLSDEELQDLFIKFKDLADKKKHVVDEDLEALVSIGILRTSDKYSLDYLHVSAGTGVKPTATVGLKTNGDVLMGAEFGNGPIDAAFNTIAKMTGTTSEMLRFYRQCFDRRHRRPGRGDRAPARGQEHRSGPRRGSGHHHGQRQGLRERHQSPGIPAR